jgi:hypothetical protein
LALLFDGIEPIMANAVEQGWQAVRRGDIWDAESSFNDFLSEHPDAPEAYAGLSTIALLRGSLEAALDYASQALNRDDLSAAQLARGCALSRLARRKQAEQVLREWLNTHGGHPLALALLGEQLIRTARWEEGVDAYVQALESDRDDMGYRQLQMVVGDLLEVVVEGRLPRNQAQSFVNQVQYNTGNLTNSQQQWFARIQRALEQETTTDRPNTADPIGQATAELALESLSNRSSTRRRQTSASNKPPPEPSSSGPPSTQQPPSRSSDGDPSRSGPRQSQDNSRATTQSPEMTPGSTAGQTATATAQTDSGRNPHINAGRKDLAGVIQSDRQQNETLQDTIGRLRPPEWPTSEAYGTIDPLPSMGYENQSIFEGRPGIDSTDFEITSGDVRTEILLERCLQMLVKAAQKERAVTLNYQPEAIQRLEVNCWDGLLERMEAVSDIYSELLGDTDPKLLAVGMFVGTSLAKPYGGTWSFGETPEDTTLEIGQTTLEPFRVVKQWMQADDPDAVSFAPLRRRARLASQMSTWLSHRRRYIDPTLELADQSLAVKLGELWAQYLFRLGEVSISKMGAAVEPDESGDHTVLFWLDPEFAPSMASGWRADEAARSDGKVPLGYVRRTGEFLMLASRKHLARLFDEAFDELTQENAARIVDWTNRFHRAKADIDRDKASLDVQGDSRTLEFRLSSSDIPPQTYRIDYYGEDQAPGWSVSASPIQS